MSSYGTDKSSGSIAESSGSSDSAGSGDAGSSSGSSGSGSGGASFEIINVSWVDTHGDDPSILDFDIINTGTEDLQITWVTGSAPGFDPIPDTYPIPLAVGMSVHVFATTEPGIDFTGSDVTVESDIAGNKTITLTL